MRKPTLFLLLISASAFPAAAQYRAHVEVLGVYNLLPSLHTFQEEAVAFLAAEGLEGAGVTNAYPAYPGLRVYVGRETGFNSPHYVGLTLSTTSTGGRLGYRDASGALHVDQRLTYRALGILYEYALDPAFGYDERKREYFLYGSPSVEWATLTHTETVSGVLERTSSRTLNALQPVVEAGAGARVPLGPRALRIAVGATWRLAQPFAASNPTSGIVTMDSEQLRVVGTEATAKSDGFGLRVGIGYTLTR